MRLQKVCLAIQHTSQKRTGHPLGSSCLYMLPLSAEGGHQIFWLITQLMQSWAAPIRSLIISSSLSNEDKDNNDLQFLSSVGISDSGMVVQLTGTSWQPTLCRPLMIWRDQLNWAKQFLNDNVHQSIMSKMKKKMAFINKVKLLVKECTLSWCTLDSLLAFKHSLSDLGIECLWILAKKSKWVHIKILDNSVVEEDDWEKEEDLKSYQLYFIYSKMDLKEH